MSAVKPREVIWDPRVKRELEELYDSPERAEEAIRGLGWTLARLAEHGGAVRDTPYSCWPIHLPDASYVVYYKYDDRRVTCLSLRKAIPPGDDLRY